MRKLNLMGLVFGKLTAIEINGKTKAGTILWLCSCECGGTKIARSNHLRSGYIKSCGCLIYEAHHITHGMSDTRIWRIWQGVKRRTLDPKFPAYKHYGGRGITITPEWLTFENFYRDMKDGYSDELSIDRIDVNGNYYKENCRWATREQQAANRQNTLYIEIDGKKQTMNSVIKAKGINYHTFYGRLKTYKLPLEKVFKSGLLPNKSFTGGHHSQATKDKISRFHKGKKKTKKHRKNISIGRKKRFLDRLLVTK